MNTPIISTEGSLKGYKAAQLILSIISLLIGFFAICMCFALLSTTSNSASYMLLVMGILIMVYGFFNLIVGNMRSRTYLKIYTNTVEGVGVQGAKAASFNLQYSQINSISTEKDWIHVYTNVGTFKILAKRELANQILDYYNSYIRNN